MHCGYVAGEYIVRDVCVCCSLGPPPAPGSRGLHKYYDTDDVDYSQDGGSAAAAAAGGAGGGGVSFDADDRRSYRSAGESPAPCRNGRYTAAASPAHDDSHGGQQSQSDWDCAAVSRHSRSPSDSGRARSRAADSDSPTRHPRRHSKEHKLMSSSASRGDCGRHDNRLCSRRNSCDHDRHSVSARTSDGVGRSCMSHVGDCVKSARTVANNVDADTSAVSAGADRDRLLRTSDASSGPTHRGGAADVGRRHSDVSRSHVIRSVVNTTPSWRFDYKQTSSHVADNSQAGDVNHVTTPPTHKLPPDTIELGSSDSASPRSKSPQGVGAVSDMDDVDVSVTTQPERPASKGGSDDMTHLEKEKSHLLNMLKELEDYSSGGGSEMDDDSRAAAALCRLHRGQRDNDHDSELDVPRPTDGAALSALPLPPSASKPCVAVEPSSSSSGCDVMTAGRLSDSCRRSSASAVKRRVSVENHVTTVGQLITSSLDAEDNIITDMIGASPPTDIPAQFTRRQRTLSDVSTDGAVRRPRRSYRPRGCSTTADSADSGTDDGQCPLKMTVQPSDAAGVSVRNSRHDDATCSSSSSSSAVHVVQSVDDASGSSSRRVSTAGAARKSSSGDSHQPCIIPDSPVTTRGPDIRAPTEPRTVSVTVTAGGRAIMDLPLPRFALDRQRGRQTSSGTAAATEHSGAGGGGGASLASTSTTATHTLLSSAVTVNTDVMAPFSPGLVSPAISPPALRPDTTPHPTTAIVTSTSAAATAEKELHLSAAGADSSPAAAAAAAAVHKDTSVESSDVKTDCEVDKPVAASDEVAIDNTADTDARKTDEKLCESEKPVVVKSDKTAPTVVSVYGAVAAVSDCDVCDLLSPGSPPDTLSLDDRIRALDEKLNQMQKTTPRHLPASDSSLSSGLDYSRFIRRRKQPNTGPPSSSSSSAAAAAGECMVTSEPSDLVKSLLSRTSIFDQDSRRLEQLHSKFDLVSTAQGSNVTESSSASLVSRMRYAGRLPAHDLSLQLPLSTSSQLTSAYRSSDVGMSSPLGLYCGRASSLVTPPPPPPPSSWAVSVTTPGSGWTAGWPGVAPAPTPDSASVCPSSHLSYGLPLTPGAVSLSCGPTDPRRVQRSSTDSSTCPSSVPLRRQDSSQSADMSADTRHALSIAVRRDSDVSTAATTKPKEMVSPPVSILKKTSTSSVPKDDIASTGSSVKMSESSQSSIDAPSTGMKRSADAAFGKEALLSTPNKMVARTAKPVAHAAASCEVDCHSIASSRVAESEQLKSQVTAVKRPEPAKKPVQLKPSVAKVDEKKTDHGTFGAAAAAAGRKVSEDAVKSVKPQTKPHSTTSASLLTSSASTVSKSHSHRDTRPVCVDSSRHTVGPKESTSADNDSADKHPSGGSSKPKTSHSVSRESTAKDRTVDNQDKSVMSEEKDSAARERSASHGSSKHHQSDHRHSEKTSRDGKPDEASRASKVSLPSSSSKNAPKSAAKDPAKPDKLDKNLPTKPKLEAWSSAKKESMETGKKNNAGHVKPSLTGKSDGEHKSEKDEPSRDKSSVSNMQTKLLKKPGADSVLTSRPSALAKSSSVVSSKPKHTEKSSIDRKNEVKKPEPIQTDKSKKPVSATTEKNKSAKKKIEKRPEEKREVTIIYTYIQWRC